MRSRRCSWRRRVRRMPPHGRSGSSRRLRGEIVSLAETYTSSAVLRDTWDDARRELRLELRAGVTSPAAGEAFLDVLEAVQLEASGAEDASTREVWVFPTLAGTREIVSLAETYTSSAVLRDTWDDARRELRLELRAGVTSPAAGEAFLDALEAVQLEASGAEDASTREVWVFPTLAGTREIVSLAERSSDMVRYYVLDASSGKLCGCVQDRRACREKLGHGSVLCAGRLLSSVFSVRTGIWDIFPRMRRSPCTGRWCKDAPYGWICRTRTTPGFGRCRAVRRKVRFFGRRPVPA